MALPGMGRGMALPGMGPGFNPAIAKAGLKKAPERVPNIPRFFTYIKAPSPQVKAPEIPRTSSVGNIKTLTKAAAPAKQKQGMELLFDWCKQVTAGYEGVAVTNFTTSWGIFWGIYHRINEKAMDLHLRL
jgi:hypothetical protein